MNHNIMSSNNHKSQLLLFYFLFIVLFMTGCASQSRLHSDYVPTGSLRLGQVAVITKRADVLQNKWVYEALIASGIKDSEVSDGCVVAARIFCCGGITDNSSSEKANARIIFVPKGIDVSLGDIVEFTVGRNPDKGDGGQLNIVTRVVQKYEYADGSCWWDPKDDRLWLRILYCDWMPREGWVKQGGINPAWYRPLNAVIPEK